MSEQNKPTPEKHTGDDKKQGGSHYRRHGKHPYRHGKHSNKQKNAAAPIQSEDLTVQEEAVIEEEELLIQEAEEITENAESFPEAEEIEKAEAPAEDVPMETTEVIGVRFRTSGKIYYFDPKGLAYPLGSHAIVDTARGMEYGEVAMTNRCVPTTELVLPLREALRIATAEDDCHYQENKAKEAEAGEVWVKKVALHGLKMKLIDIECTFDNSKLLFYFTAEGRVDFRDLVKDLASVFRCRIELRQMGIRDEAKILGGLGVCGRPFCCHSFLPDFVQVSIKMAKEQNLSLNSAKISGACGRLMCCLRYEYDTYLEEAKLTPKVDSLVRTPDGVGTVIETKPLLGLVKVQPINTADAPAVVYSRELLTPIKPGDPIEVPAPAPTPAPQIKDKIEKQPDATPKSQKGQHPKKRPDPSPEKKKAEPEHPKKNEKQHPKLEKSEKIEKTDATAQESPVKEHKYVIQRGENAKGSENSAQSSEKTHKKRYGYHHHRQNRDFKEPREKKGGEQS